MGEVSVSGAKNSVLKLMAAALLAEGTTTITAVPDILDVAIMSEVLRRLGCDVVRGEGSVAITVPAMPGHEADYDLVRRMRASIAVLGPLVARCGQAKVALPGGDAIGSRGVDMHVAGLVKLGATVESEHGYLIARAPRLTGAQVWLDFPSVGATENLLMAAVLAKGATTIDNAAREPDIVDLCHLLVDMGAQLGGIGTSTLEIEGVETLHPTTHETVPDRIVAGTWAYAAALTRGDVFVRGGRAEHLQTALDKLTLAGAVVSVEPGGFRVRMDERPRAVDVVTLPYPGFPTDLQPQMSALLATVPGTSVVQDPVYPDRLTHVAELTRMGANITVSGYTQVIQGAALHAAPVKAADLRAGAALFIAGLTCEGDTVIDGVQYLNRGYERLAERLRGLGANVMQPEGLLAAAD